MIFYFSATGNSKYAAERIASAAGDRTVFLRDAVRGRSYRYDVSREERIGFVFPVYFWGLPSILRFFVEKLELTGYRDQYIYAVMTCGGSTGGAADQLTGLLEKKGLSLSAQFGIPMVDNYVPMFKVVGPEEAEARLDAAEEYIDEAARAIRGLEREDAGQIPIIAMTANAFAEDEKAALDAGMDAHVPKPLNMELLKKVIQQFSRRKEYL